VSNQSIRFLTPFPSIKLWIEQYLKQFSAQFGVDLLGFAILSNHFHLILRTRPDVVAAWSGSFS
jgi:REP element-mobilizing transposase RayT